MENKIEFDIINFLIPSHIESIRLVINQYNLIFKKHTNYADALKKLKKYRNYETTALLEINIPVSVEESLNFTSKVNHLLTICRSTIINYTGYRILDENYNVVSEKSQDPIASKYSIHELIPNECIEETRNFVINGIRKFDDLDKILLIRKVAREYAFVRNEAAFVNTRGLSICVLIEYIINSYINHKNKSYLINEELFNSKLDELKLETEKILSNIFGTLIKPPIAKAMISKLKDFNRRPFKWKMQKFKKAYKLNLEEGDINNFIFIRDTLAHSGSYPKEKRPFEYWIFLLFLLDKIIVGLFQYNDYYADLSKEEFYLTQRRIDS